MKFLLFNLVAMAALAYLFIRDGGPAETSLPELAPLAVPASVPPPSAPTPAAMPPVQAAVDVAPRPVHRVPEGKVETMAEDVAGPPPLPTAAERRRDLDRLIGDMDRFAGERLAR